MATIYPASNENISLLGKLLLKGEIVAVPTETVYGLAAHAFDDSACARVFKAKARPAFDPLIVHIPLNYDLERIAETHPSVDRLTRVFWPGPFTIVLKKKPVIPDLVTAGLDSVAIRMPRHPVFQRLLATTQVPLAAPSANPFGYVSPTSAQHVQESLGDRISHILDGGPCEIGLESTILDLRDPAKPLLLRPGAISRAEIADVLQTHVSLPDSQKKTPVMPGTLLKHYSPRCTCSLRERIPVEEALEKPEVAFLFFGRPPLQGDVIPENIFWLSETGDEAEAARSLFRMLRLIDARRFPSLIVERAPSTLTLSAAINDRLQRAAADDPTDD